MSAEGRSSKKASCCSPRCVDDPVSVALFEQSRRSNPRVHDLSAAKREEQDVTVWDVETFFGKAVINALKSTNEDLLRDSASVGRPFSQEGQRGYRACGCCVPAFSGEAETHQVYEFAQWIRSNGKRTLCLALGALGSKCAVHDSRSASKQQRPRRGDRIAEVLHRREHA